jgi:predicted nuclease with TOPRIM domain
MSNLLEHLKEMKSQAELVDAWQKAFDVAIRLCTKKDTVIADLQSDNERLNEEYIKAHRLLIVRLGKIYELQEKYDKLKDRLEGAPTLNVRRDETIIDNGLSLTVKGDSRLHIEDNGNRAWTQMWTKTALVELTPEEMDGEL